MTEKLTQTTVNEGELIPRSSTSRKSAAIDALGALGQARRLEVFRLLIGLGEAELPAGEIGQRLSIQPSNLSFHLAHLERAGLIKARRARRNVLYSINIEGVRELIWFLVQDCCGGAPELCGFTPTSAKRSA